MPFFHFARPLTPTMQRRPLPPLCPSRPPCQGPLAASAVPTSCLASVMRSATLTTKFPNVAAVLFAFVSFTVVPFICMTAEHREEEGGGGKHASESGDDTKGITDVITSGLIRVFCGIRVQISAKLLDSPCVVDYVPSNPKDDLDLLSFLLSCHAHTMPAKDTLIISSELSKGGRGIGGNIFQQNIMKKMINNFYRFSLLVAQTLQTYYFFEVELMELRMMSQRYSQSFLSFCRSRATKPRVLVALKSGEILIGSAIIAISLLLYASRIPRSRRDTRSREQRLTKSG